MGHFWAILGHSWAILGHLESYLGHFGPFCGIFGQICRKFNFFCGIVGVAILAFRMYEEDEKEKLQNFTKPEIVHGS